MIERFPDIAVPYTDAWFAALARAASFGVEAKRLFCLN